MKKLSCGFLFFGVAMAKTMIIGHRGACGYAPENTIKSFKKAIELGLVMTELDVHLCKSGDLVVIHDDTVDRTTDGTGYVADKTWDELRKLDAGEGERIPNLTEVLNFVDHQIKMDIELKGPHTAEPTAKIIHQFVDEKGWSYSDFLVTSFNHEELKLFHKLCPEVKIGAIFSKLPDDLEGVISHLNPDVIIVSHKYITPEFVAKMHALEKLIFVYTVNDQKRLEEVKNMGVDGIFTDYPRVGQEAPGVQLYGGGVEPC